MIAYRCCKCHKPVVLDEGSECFRGCDCKELPAVAPADHPMFQSNPTDG